MRKFRFLLFSLCITGLYLSLATPAFAARNYLIELVIFSTQDAGDTEKWTSADPPLNARKMAKAVFPGKGELELKIEPVELKESVFSKYVQRIRNNPRRKIILSTHWIQPVSAPASTIIAHISDQKVAMKNPTEIQADNASRYNGSQIPVPLINGFINFYLDSQYTLEADLRYTPPYRPSILDEEPASGPVSYRIHEKRRMKSGELNYYDHPKFGMVLLVTPVEVVSE